MVTVLGEYLHVLSVHRNRESERRCCVSLPHTLAAILPHPQVHPGDIFAAAVAMRELRHLEHVPLHAGDVV
jgi:hypothetical protein